MEKIEFSKHIDAPREKVWQVLFSNDTYPDWTAFFCEGSHAVTDWQKGSKVWFLDKNQSGMMAEIEESKSPEFMSFATLGAVKNGVEDLESEEAQMCKGGHENYYLADKNGGTELRVTLEGLEMPAEMSGFLLDAWPKAMEKIKSLAETA